MKIVFKTNVRIIITIQKNNIQHIQEILQNIQSGKLTAIYTDNETFESIRKILAQKSSKVILVRCTKFLEDVVGEIKQKELINKYHEESNHRGINETVQHVSRTHYFPRMKEVIKQIINNCVVCKTFKYDRNEKPLKYELSETPTCKYCTRISKW